MRTDIPTGWEEYIDAGYLREIYIDLLQDPTKPMSPGTYAYHPKHLQSGTLTKKLFDKPSIGNAACATLIFKTLTPTYGSKFDTSYPAAFNFYPQTIVRPRILLRESGSDFLSLRLNKFYTDERRAYARPESDYGKIGSMEFVCYDRMIYAEEIYTDDRQDVSYPMPAADVVDYIAERLGVGVDDRNEIGDFLVDSPIEVYTMREVLRFIAAGSGGNFTINGNEKLQLVPFVSAEVSAEEPCSALDYNEAVTVTGVRLFPDGSTEYFSGDDSGLVIEGECAYATQALCDAVAAKLVGKVYRGFEANDVRLDPAAELGDSIRFGGIDFVINSINYTFSAALAATVGSPFREDVNHQIPFHDRQSRFQRETAQSFSEIRKSTEAIELEVSKKTSTEDVNALIKVSTDGITQSFDAKLKGKAGTDEVKNMISSGINGITISSQQGTAANSASITLSNGDIGFEATGTITMGNVTVDSISADKITGKLNSDKINLYGDLTVYQSSALASSGGTLGYTPSTLDGSGGIHLKSSGSEVRATSTGAALQGSGGGKVVCTGNANISGSYIYLNALSGQQQTCEVGGNYFAPSADWGMYCGLDGQRWATVYCGSVSESSDRALKKDIEHDLDKYGAFFDALQPCRFRFIREGNAGKVNTGLIAQEVDEALVLAGLGREDFAGLNMSDKEGASGLAYSQFIALLIDQVQKLKKRVDELEQRN